MFSKNDIYIQSLSEDLFIVIMFYVFFKFLLLGALVELIWPTQFFNRRHTQNILINKHRTFVEVFTKLRVIPLASLTLKKLFKLSLVKFFVLH